jgi:hypothetical protein
VIHNVDRDFVFFLPSAPFFDTQRLRALKKDHGSFTPLPIAHCCRRKTYARTRQQVFISINLPGDVPITLYMVTVLPQTSWNSWCKTQIHMYPVSHYFTVSEPPKYVKARRRPLAMALPLPRTATPHGRIWVIPFGQDDKRPSALLRSLALASVSPALTRLAIDRISSC